MKSIFFNCILLGKLFPVLHVLLDVLEVGLEGRVDSCEVLV